MQTASALSHNRVEDALTKAVLFSFAMCDYEGEESIALKSVSGSDVFEDVSIDVVNKAMNVTQRAALISWDDTEIGRICLTESGRAKFFTIRDEFFDADAISLLKENLEAIDTAHQVESQVAIIRAKAGQPCPKSGLWQSQDAKAMVQSYQAGDSMKDLQSPYGITVWVWMRE